MSASKIRADYEQLAAIAQAFGQQAEAARQMLGALKDGLETLQGGDWVGQSADRFYAEMKSSVLPAVQRVAAAMTEAASTTTKISQVMKQAEDQSAALFRLDGGPGLAGAGSAAAAPAAGPAAFARGDAAGGKPKPGGQGGDARAKQIQPILDEANHLKEMYDDTHRVKLERWAKYREARRLNKGRNEILRLYAEYRAARNAEKFYKEDLQKKYDEAIALTARLYKLDVSAIRGKPVYGDELSLSGYTDWDRSVTIGPGGVEGSPGWLASTIGHEAMHARQMKEGRAYDEEENLQGHLMNEVESYHWELANAQRNGLTPAEIDAVKKLTKPYYDQLTPENKKRVDRGVYAPAPSRTP